MNLSTQLLGEPGREWRDKSKAARPRSVCVGCGRTITEEAPGYRLGEPHGVVQELYRACNQCYNALKAEFQTAWKRV